MDTSKKLTLAVPPKSDLHILELDLIEENNLWVNPLSDQPLSHEDFNRDNLNLPLSPNRLNSEQLEVYNYVINNPTKITQLQAGPGCGKSFTLQTLAYCINTFECAVVIYKRDLLDPYLNFAIRMTLAKFWMAMFGSNYQAIKHMGQQLESNSLTYEFFWLAFTGLARKAKLPNFRQVILIMDECIVNPKAETALVCMMCKYHRIGLVLSGDKDQLQSFHNSKHSRTPAYDLYKQFADKTFFLTKNQRCKDEEYNEVISLFAQVSSEARIGAYGYAMINAVFPEAVCRVLVGPNSQDIETVYNYTHIASTHQDLTDRAFFLHTKLSEKLGSKIHFEYYQIESRAKRDVTDPLTGRVTSEIVTQLTLSVPAQAYQAQLSENVSSKRTGSVPYIKQNFQFLSYLPLIPGALYFTENKSELNLSKLVSFNTEEGSVTVQVIKTKQFKTLYKNSKDFDVIPEQHLGFLRNGGTGKVYNYPLYPAQFYTSHKCQGMTIEGNITIKFGAWSTYQTAYVNFSRTVKPEQIQKIEIPDQISHQVSTIINFPDLANNVKVTAKKLQEVMKRYVFYSVEKEQHKQKFGMLAARFFHTTDVEIRKKIATEIVREKKVLNCKVLKPDKPKTSEDAFVPLVRLMAQPKLVFAMSNMSSIDRRVWFREFILNCEKMHDFLPQNFMGQGAYKGEREYTYNNSMERVTELDVSFTMDVSTESYILAKSKVSSYMEGSDSELYMEEAENDCCRYAETAFCATLYRRLKRREPITTRWLMDQLNIMLKQNMDRISNNQ